jgi:hypothetical protein
MRRILRFALLLAVPSAIAVGCSGGGDDDDDDAAANIDVTIGCAGPACGLTGALKVPLHEGTCASAPLLTLSVPAVTTSSNGEEAVALDGLVSGSTYCVEVWLDVDTSGTLSIGDAIASSGGQIVTPTGSAELDFTLDALQP